MAAPVHTTNILSNVSFSKPGTELKEHGEARLAQLKSKIEERNERIARIRKEYEISDSDLIELMRKSMNDHNHLGTYSLRSGVGGSAVGGSRPSNGSQNTERMIPAGVIQNILTEQTTIENEQEQVDRLELILRNIDTNCSHRVSLFDLEYLDF